MKALLPLLTVLLLSAAMISAQETPEAADWITEERCITAPSHPPEGWTYDGVIFTFRLYDGIHARRADMPTRYYVAFDSEKEFGQSGSFSSDGHWFAVPEGHMEYGTRDSRRYFLDEIRVYSTTPAREKYRMTIYDTGWTYDFPNVPPVRWLDNQHILASGIVEAYSNYPTGYILNPFEQSILPLDISSNQAWLMVSPDGTKRIYGAYDIDRWAYYLVFADNPLSPRVSLPIRFPDQPFFTSIAQWTADSSKFAAFLKSGNQVGIFDATGRMISIVPLSNTYRPFSYARNGERLGFIDESGTIFITDFATHTITDTCIHTPYSIAFSPDGRQLAFGLEPAGYVYILDLEAWEAYRIDLAAADVIGWYPLE